MMRRRDFMAVGAAAAAASAAWRPAQALAADGKVRLAYVRSWPSGDLATLIAAQILRRDLHRQVELISTEAGPMWAAVAGGRVDATLTAWLPTTHRVYWERYRHKLVDLGPVTSGTWLGLAVPGYVPLDSIDQLEAHHARFGNRIVGIEAGTGLMINTREAIRVYGLHDLSLLTSSTAAMHVQLQRAIARKQWIVVTAWKPLGIWARFDLKPLQDPKHVYGQAGHIDAVIHPALQQQQPQVARLLGELRVPIEDIQAMMVEVDKGKPLDEVTGAWIAAHRGQIDAWVKAANA
jgi:glycine betaine/proline transport system substrate-binding protein